MTLYEHVQPGTAMRIGLGGAVAFIVISALITGDSTATVWVLAVALAVLLVLHHSLTVRMDSDHLEVAFGPGLIRHTIAVDQITSASMGRCAWYNGWGTRLTGSGWMYRVSGMDTVDLQLTTGAFRIGTDDPQGLLTAIEQAMAAR